MVKKQKLKLGEAYAFILKFGLKNPTFSAFRQAMDLALQQLKTLSPDWEVHYESFSWGADDKWSAEVFKFQRPDLEMWVGTLIDTYEEDGTDPGPKDCNNYVILRCHIGKHAPAMAGPTVAITNPIVHLGYELLDLSGLDFPTILDMIDSPGEKMKKRKGKSRK
jgi:hypothetical protein